MQEIKKRRIVIASVLKPVDDTRMFEKFGHTLSTVHEVHVVGFGPASADKISSMQHPIGIFPRMSLSRLLAPWRILNIIWKLKPDLLIVCTHELLCQGALAKLTLKCRLWYDVQENYARNIRSTNSFPPILRSFVAVYVRIKERLLAPAIEQYLIAEESYADEMPYLRSRAVVISNKVCRKDFVIRNRHTVPSQPPLKLIFTGTLSDLTGVFVAIDIAQALHAVHPVILSIIGFCPQESMRDKLIQRCRDLDFVTLKTGDVPMAHTEIVTSIAMADVGIISYPRNRATWDCVPTKLYEYLASRLPLLLINNPKWTTLAASYHAAVVFDPTAFQAGKVLGALLTGRFYTADPQDVYWESEAELLLQLV